MFELFGMAIIGVALVVPLIIGVGSASKSVYQFMINQGASKNNALTAAVVGLLMLVGIMTSPLFLGVAPLRVLAGISYLYFLYTGGKTIVNFFTGGDTEKKGEDQPKHSHDADCQGCDHEDHGKHSAGPSHPAEATPAPDAEVAAKQPSASPVPHRSPAEIRAEIERRIAEGDGKEEGK